MGRLRKDYLTRQRSTPFKCQAYMFVHRCCLLQRRLLLTGLSCQSGEEGNIFEQSRLAASMLPHYSLEQCLWLEEHAHCLSLHSFPYIFSPHAGRSSHQVRKSSHYPFFFFFFWQTIRSSPMLLALCNPFDATRPRNIVSDPTVSLATFLLSYSLWYLPFCLKKWSTTSFACPGVKIWLFSWSQRACVSVSSRFSFGTL